MRKVETIHTIHIHLSGHTGEATRFGSPRPPRHLHWVLAALLAVACSDASENPPEADAAPGEVPPNTLTEAERAAGWRLLFDGETTDGWRRYNSDEFPDTGWAVADGLLVVGAAIWHNAPEYQVLDDPAYIEMGTMDMNTHLTGDNYDLPRLR